MTIRRLPADMFRFAVGERSDLYTAMLQVFGDANERLETTLSLDDVGGRLRNAGWAGELPEDVLFGALRQLRDWRLLDVTQNHAGNYRTADEYERRNLLYALTRHGEAALAGLEHAAAVLASTGALQTAVLEAIADRLAELGRLVADPASGDRRIFTALQELEGHLDGLRSNTKRFYAQLQRLLRAEGAEQETFREVKVATVAYLEEFLTNLDLRVYVIAEAVDEIEKRGIDNLLGRALAGAELPQFAGSDPGPEWLTHRHVLWEGVRAWFRPADGGDPRAQQLHAVGRRAIVTLLQTLDRLNESRRRSSSAASDLRELARWFAQAPAEADLHRLWSAAFGLGSARHAHLAHPDPELITPGTRWADAPAVPVSKLIRTAGRTERFSRTGRVRDVAAVRRGRAERARKERAELEAAWRSLATGGEVALSNLGDLDHPTFERLLDLLGRALASPADNEGARRGQSIDGQVVMILRPPTSEATARVRTPHGVFTGPDYLVEVVITTRAGRPAAEGVG